MCAWWEQKRKMRGSEKAGGRRARRRRDARVAPPRASEEECSCVCVGDDVFVRARGDTGRGTHEYSADKSGPARLDVDGLYKGTRATCERRTPPRRRLRFERQRERSRRRTRRERRARLSFSPRRISESELGLADLGLHRARLAPARRVLEARLRARRAGSARGEAEGRARIKLYQKP